MNIKPALRYIVSGAVGILIAGVIFYSLASWTNTQFELEGESNCLCYVEFLDCRNYEITGTIQNKESNPIPYADIFILHGEDKLSSNADSEGKFKLKRDSSCEDGPETIVMNINAENYKPGIFVFNLKNKQINVALEKQGF